MTRNCHVRFGERGRETHPSQDGKVRSAPTLFSPVIANMALDGLGQHLMERFPPPKKGSSPKVHLARYADDFVVTGASKELLEREVKPVIEEFLRERGLHLSPEKTVITHIKEGFDFLGQNVRKYQSGMVLTIPSKKNVKAFLAKVRGTIEKLKGNTASLLILKLNPLIRGWANSHRFGASGETFKSVDNAIYEKLWWWARRRHPGKSLKWVKQKYFTTVGNRNWIFTGEVKDEKGTIKYIYLQLAADVKIRRHKRIQGAANPFDPAWETYFEKRLDVKMEESVVGKRQLLHLWKEQNGLCPMCKQKITKLTGWHSHHVIWRSKGGTDGANNRVLLHPNCHMQLHSQGLHVEKPRPAKKQGVRKA